MARGEEATSEATTAWLVQMLLGQTHMVPILIAEAGWTTLQWRLAMETGDGDWTRPSFGA